MQRDPHAFLWDAERAAGFAIEFTAGHSFESYLADPMRRAAVKRQIEIIGEALNALARTAPDIAARLPDLRNAVAMRNMLIHGYAEIRRDVVWATVIGDLPGPP